MTSFTVNSGVTDTHAKTLTGDDTGAVQAGGVLSDGADILWSGGSNAPGATIDNAGVITATKRAIDTSGNFSTGSLTIDNHDGAQIVSTGADAIRINTVVTDGTITVDNAGTIQAAGTGGGNGQAIDFAAMTSTSAHIHILNEAAGLITAADADAIRPGVNTTLDNYGHIVGLAAADDDGNDAVDFQGNTGGVVHNHAGGVIQGTHHGVTGDHGVTVINDAGATLVGGNGSGVNIDSTGDASDTTFVTNYGQILGESANQADSDGDAIDVDGLVRVDNYGAVKGLGANGEHDGGANVSEGLAIGGGVVNNFAGGLIYGFGRAIQVDNSADGPALGSTTIYNEGLIQGDGHGPQNFDPGADAGIVLAGREAIDIIGSAADTITNKGQIVGGVFTDGGDDTFNAYAGSTVTGPIDLGDGHDTLNLEGAGQGAIAAIANVESVNFDSGDWTLGLDHSFTGLIHGFTNTDTIDLHGIGLATSAKLGPGGVLTLGGEPGGPVTLHLDPGQSFAGYVFQLSSDGAGGTDLTVAKVINGGNGNQALTGTAGADVITGGNGNDTINSGDGADRVSGGNGNDVVHAGAGNVSLDGGNGDDVLQAGNGDDALTGGNGNDVLQVGAGNSVLDGGNGNDTFKVGTGDNTLTGGNGNDSFVFGPVFGRDVVTDFRPGDHIEFDHAFANFQAVHAAMHQVGSSTAIEVDATHEITLHGVSMASLHASDFIFH